MQVINNSLTPLPPLQRAVGPAQPPGPPAVSDRARTKTPKGTTGTQPSLKTPEETLTLRSPAERNPPPNPRPETPRPKRIPPTPRSLHHHRPRHHHHHPHPIHRQPPLRPRKRRTTAVTGGTRGRRRRRSQRPASPPGARVRDTRTPPPPLRRQTTGKGKGRPRSRREVSEQQVIRTPFRLPSPFGLVVNLVGLQCRLFPLSPPHPPPPRQKKYYCLRNLVCVSCGCDSDINSGKTL